VTDYKKYSLGQLENFLHDAMSAAEATPQEIYDVIKGVVEENYYTYKHQASQAYELLALLNGNGVGHLTCDKDDTSEECKKSWNDFWVEDLHRTDYTEEELNAMCDASEAKDKVNKWIIPVDDDYNITFPEDLLEQTGWKEGDVLEWIDQGDGSFKLIKKEKKEHPSWVRGNELSKVKTYQEMIDDGWSMTGDGFWIKEN
jgi:bifunctional DNA-binding transcriptional regulator/antitoxin component of YhaV-PrlF toxin-antitoxin module